MDDDAIITRAVRAYLQRGPIMAQPSRDSCSVDMVAGKHYAVLRNGGGILAVYEVAGNPQADYNLVGLKSWPAALE